MLFLDTMESHLISTSEVKLTCKTLQEKLNFRFELISFEKKRRNAMRKCWWQNLIHSSKEHVAIVVSMATSQIYQNTQRMRAEKEIKAQKVGISKMMQTMASNSVTNASIAARLGIKSRTVWRRKRRPTKQ